MNKNGFKYYNELNDTEKNLVNLLCSGSDERSLIDSEGLNKYGGATFPRQTINFSSCTNSTISQRGWKVAELERDKFVKLASEIGEFKAAEEVGQFIQNSLLELMDLKDINGLKVVLTPSGTDAESIAVFIASLSSQKNFVNIVMGAREVGSGTALASGVRYFSKLTPNGGEREAGAILNSDLAKRVKVHQVKIRVDTAAERSPEDLDNEIRQLVEENIAVDRDVILHIVAHSKTGVHAPRLETMKEMISIYGQRIKPIIDAAQGRFSRRGLRDYISRGYMVILTGSKFYGGPPFSGCLLIPDNFFPIEQADIVFPSGFSDYITAAQLPANWTAARNSLNQTINFGLLLRWLVALDEMTLYYATPDNARYRILRFFESQAPIILSRSPLLELINPPVPIFENVYERLLESKTTVFSFRVRIKEKFGYQLDQKALARWIKWMNQDISAIITPEISTKFLKAAETCFQLGQAVHVGEKQSGEADYVIRVAIGSLLITQIAGDEYLGKSLDERLAWLENSLENLRLKFEFIAENEAALLQLAEIK